MSFILDALKKSEIERQRQAIPGLMDSGAPAARAKFPLWAAALVALLAINLAVLVVVLTRGAAPATPAGAASQSAPGRAVRTGLAVRAGRAVRTAPFPGRPRGGAGFIRSAHARCRRGTRRTGSFQPLGRRAGLCPGNPGGGGRRGPCVRAGLEPGGFERNAGTAGGRQASPSGGAPALRAGRARDPVLVEDAGGPDDEVLPSISEINLAGGQALPELHLDVHVFATKPSERFVYINMRKYREGATLAEGPVLERIRRDGVILNFNGLRFVLPRQQ